MMELVSPGGGTEWPDKARSKVVGWADDLREWIEVLGGGERPGAGSEPQGMTGPRATVVQLMQVLERSVMEEDWPVIVRAHQAAAVGHWRGLMALDREWGLKVSGRGGLAEASLRAGQRQLARMRPMRDSRVVQRYLAAVESGEARGWHPVVFGMLLAVHCIPLRQGLAHHAMQVAGVLSRALLGGPPAEGDRRRLEFEAGVVRVVPAAMDRALEAGGARGIQPCPA